MQPAGGSSHTGQEIIGEAVGSLDQVMAAFRGLRYVQFHRDGKITADPLPLPAERLAELQAHLMLFYTGITRTASDVAKSYVTDIGAQRRHLESMRRMVEESVDLLVSGMNLQPFGRLLHEAWQTKRSLSTQVSTPGIDALYTRARHAGALGGKLTGAGGGGFLLFVVPPERKPAVRQALAPLLEVPFAFET